MTYIVLAILRQFIDDGPYDQINDDPILNNNVNNIINMNVLFEIIYPNMSNEPRQHTKFMFGKAAEIVRYTLKKRNPHIPLTLYD